MRKSIVPQVKNVALVLLTIICMVLVARLWFGGLYVQDFFSPSPPTASPSGINPWDESAAPLVIGSMQMSISTDALNYHVFYNSITQNSAWINASLAIEHLIAEGVFMRSGTLDGGQHHELTDKANISFQYSFPMPSSFFREFFGTRPGFLSSHFENFNTLIIAPDPTTQSLDFFFIRDDSNSYYVFSLNSAHHYEIISGSIQAAVIDHPPPAVYGDIVWVNPIHDLTLYVVAAHINFFFPNPSLVVNNIINNIYTYSDGSRVGRFFPNNVVEFTAMPTQASATDFTHALLAAFDMINNDALAQKFIDPNAPKNEVILVGFSYDSSMSIYRFYFDYILNDNVLHLSNIYGLPQEIGHGAEIHVLGHDVIFYRRLMLNFSVRYDQEELLLPIDYEYTGSHP